ncbi:FHA domain-containing protein [Bordetella tumulicola]
MKLTVQQRPEDSGLIAPWSAVFDAPGGTLGRSTDNHLTLPDADGGICRVQAAVRISDDTCYLVNLSSMSRVSINGRAILRDQEVPLAPGDELVIGSYTLKAEDPSTATVDNAAPAALAGAFAATHDPQHDPLLAEPDPLLESPLLDIPSPHIQPVVPVATGKAAVEAASVEAQPASVKPQPVTAPAEPSVAVEPVAAAQPTAMAEPTPAIPPATSTKPAVSAEPVAAAQPATSAPPIVSAHPADSPQPAAPDQPVAQPSPADLDTTPPINVADTATPPTEPTTPAPSPVTPATPVSAAVPAAAASAPLASPRAQEFAAPPPSGSPFDDTPSDEALLPDFPPTDTSTTDVFSDLFGGPGTVPVGSAPDVSAHPFDMESAQNRNPEDPLRHLPRGDANVSGPLRDPLDALGSHDDNDGHNVFSDQTPSTLPSDDPLAPHRLDPLGETLNSAREQDNNGWAARDNLREYGGFLRPARVQQPAPKKDTSEDEPSPPRRK